MSTIQHESLRTFVCYNIIRADCKPLKPITIWLQICLANKYMFVQQMTSKQWYLVNNLTMESLLLRSACMIIMLTIELARQKRTNVRSSVIMTNEPQQTHC